MSSQTQIEREQALVQKAEVETQEEQKAVTEDVGEEKSIQKEMKKSFGLCDPDLIEIGGGNPFNFYPF